MITLYPYLLNKPKARHENILIILPSQPLLLDWMKPYSKIVPSPYEINLANYREFALKTAEIFVTIYTWYFMPPTLHKVLIHGASIIGAAPLPIGMFSEEAQESRNKDCRRFREKASRTDGNTDLVHHLLITSDPIITSVRRSPKTTGRSIPDEVLNLFSAPKLNYRNTNF
ncbi:hypothetical protein J437_LFUL019103 [Ladona fulva]|uniref:Uncharacterized protein n=1 Tax=Ladona fulva TaxID=123851 RepID=A0A8K0KSK6_LADFU|nr:hypothetical protein J437_LFUL019103 [Ladona fulva]